MHQTPINPFYAARLAGRFSETASQPKRSIYAKLPLAPINRSPVPGLTSLYHNAEAGEYGDRGYPGNCPGNLIRDLLRYFSPQNVFDPLCVAAHNGSSVAMWVMWRSIVSPLRIERRLRADAT